MASENFKKLNLSNAFLFAAALEDPEICRLVLEIILERPIDHVTVKPERNILFSSDFRSVRLDVYASDQVQVGYHLEMQNKNERNLPKRTRYHQAEIDISSLKPGDNFNQLKPTYIIFICSFDPFGKRLYRYTIEKRFAETGDLYDDETHVVFLNTKGRNPDDVPELLVDFLKYVESSTDRTIQKSNNDTLKKLHTRVQDLKDSRELEGRYMWLTEWLESELEDRLDERLKDELEERLKDEREKMQQEAVSNQERFRKLFLALTDSGNQEDLDKALHDPEALEELYTKYNI